MTSIKKGFALSASKIVLLMILILIFISNASAEHTLVDGLVSYYTYDIAYEANDSLELYNGTTTSVTHSATYKLGDRAYQWTLAGSKIDIGNMTPHIPNFNFTIAMWFKAANSASYRSFYGTEPFFDDSGLTGIQAILRPDGAVEWRVLADVPGSNIESTLHINNATFEDNTWHLAVFALTHDLDGDGTYDPEDCNIYMDGYNQSVTIDADQDDGSMLAFPPMTRKVTHGVLYLGTWPMSGYIDEVAVWNRTLTGAEILQLWNEGDGLQYPFETSIDIEWIQPVNDSAFTSGNNISVEFNHSGTGQVNCSINDSDFSLTSNSSFEYLYSNNTALSDGYYSIKAECNQSDTDGNATIFFLVDYSEPVITFNNPSANNSILNMSQLINTSCEDANLYEFEGYIWNGTNKFFNWSNRSLTITHDSFSWPLITGPGGSYTIISNCSDGHTDNDISDLIVESPTAFSRRYSYKGSVLNEYFLDSNIGITQLSTAMHSDRYSTKLLFTKPDLLTWNSLDSLYIKRAIQCNTPLTIRDSSFDAHFICGRLWTDSEKVNFDNKVTVKKINDFYYEITEYIPRTSIDTKYTGNDIEIEYRSVGIVNTINRHLNFTYNKHPPRIVSDAGTYITVNYTDIPQTFTFSDAELTINKAWTNNSDYSITVGGAFANTTAEPPGNNSVNVTIEDAGGLQNSTIIYLNIVDQIKPIVGFYLDNGTSFLPGDIFLNYSVEDFSNISNCSIYLNGIKNTTNRSIVEIANNFTLVLNTLGTYYYSFDCIDEYSNIESTSNRSFVIQASMAGVNPYNNTVMDNSDLINTDALDPNTVSGVLLLFLLFCMFAFFIILGEALVIPVFGFMAGAIGIVMSMVIFAKVSVIFGAVVVAISLFVILRSAFGYD